MDVSSDSGGALPGTDGARDALQASVRFLRVLWLHRTYVVAVLMLAGVLGGMYYSSTTRIYEAVASLLVMQAGPEVWEASMSSEMGRQSLIPTHEKLIASAVVLRSTKEGGGSAAPPRPGMSIERWLAWPDGRMTSAATTRTGTKGTARFMQTTTPTDAGGVPPGVRASRAGAADAA